MRGDGNFGFRSRQLPGRLSGGTMRRLMTHAEHGEIIGGSGAAPAGAAELWT